MTEKKGCYWCKHRKKLMCSLSKNFNMGERMEAMGWKPTEENLKKPLNRVRTGFFGSACKNFERGTSKEKVVFT